jgi:hypothetical protein
MKRMRTKLAIGAGAALAAAGGGAAFAATQGTPAQESNAIIDDAAKELGIDSAKLGDALENALEKRVDEAVAAGRLTKEQGAELKARIESGAVPLLGLRGGRDEHHGHPGGHLDAAATFLGLTEDALRERLHAGDTLADVAKAEGKTVAALVDALVAAQKQELADAVEGGRLTDAQRDGIVEHLEARVTDRVNGTFRGPRGGHGFRGGPDRERPAGGEPGSRFGGGAGPDAAA